MSMRRRVAVSLAWSCLTMLVVQGCQRSSSAPPNVVIILLDTLRADHLGVYGDERGLTPFLDRLAARGALFVNAYATSSWTMPSVASLFTSRYPTQHHVNTLEAKLSLEETTLAESLAARGYRAAGFTNNFHVSEALGYSQGFDHWQAFRPLEKGQAKMRGDVLRINSLRWLEGVEQATPPAPVLLYYQYMEPHAPYEPPEPFRSRWALPHAPGADATANRRFVEGELWGRTAEDIALLASLYAGEVAALDEELHRLFTDLQSQGILDHAVVVITADHGEEFGERGALGHGFTLFNEQVRVPLIILAPGVKGRRIEQPVSLLDLAPTVLQLAGVEAPPRFEGRSLVPLMTGAAAAPVDVVAELEPSGQTKDLRAHNAALMRDTLKLTRSTDLKIGAQLFDLAADPHERAPNPPALSDARQAMAEGLIGHAVTLKARGEQAPEQATLDEATREKLRALGYHAE